MQVERRRRIRDLTHQGQRWIASVLADEVGDGVWRGKLVFFLDESDTDRQVDDRFRFEAWEFAEIVAQATALSPEEVDRRLSRALGELS